MSRGVQTGIDCPGHPMQGHPVELQKLHFIKCINRIKCGEPVVHSQIVARVNI